MTGDYTKYGISTSESDSYYGNNASDVLKADWGTAIDNTGTWRTPSAVEIKYLLDTRTTTTNLGTANARYSKVQVNGIKGLLIYPDTFTWTSDMGTQPQSSNINQGGVNYPNSYTEAQFLKMQEAGCVFLPAAGRRTGSSTFYNVGVYGGYWSSTVSDATKAYYLDFDAEKVNPMYVFRQRHYGRSVRLVRDANLNAGVNENYIIGPVIPW